MEHFEFSDLDDTTRRFMLEEVDAAVADPTRHLYFSKRFNSKGNTEWPGLLREAAESHDEHWLAYQIEDRALMKGLETANKPKGGYTTKHVPHTAAETMADGQFNRYYMMGVCRRAIDERKEVVTVYRAKPVEGPRPESEALIGTTFDPQALLDEIRPRDSSLKNELLKPNSGLSIRL